MSTAELTRPPQGEAAAAGERAAGPCGLAAAAALRAAPDLSALAQPGAARRAGRDPGAARHRARGWSAPRRGDGGGRARVPRARSPATGCSWRFLSLVVMLTLMLPLAVAVVAGDSIAGEAGHGTLRYLLTVPGGPDPAAGDQVHRARGVLRGRLPAGRAGRAGGRRDPVPDRAGDAAVGHHRLAGCRAAAAAARGPVRGGGDGRARPRIGLAISTFTEHAIAAIAAILVIAMASEVADSVSQFAPCTRTCPRTGGCRSTGCSARRWPGATGPRTAVVRVYVVIFAVGRLGPVHHRRRHQLTSMTASRCHCSAVISATGAPGLTWARISSRLRPAGVVPARTVLARTVSARAEGWR